MLGVATEKVPGGKLVRVKVDFDSRINKVQITGDFFMHPEEMVEEIERCFTNEGVDFDNIFLKNKIEELIKKNNIMLVGVSADDIIRLVKQAMNAGK